MKQFIAKYNEIIVSMDTTWLPLSENTPLVQLSTIGWPRRSLWSYSLSDDDTFEVQPQLELACRFFQ
jgi:hypothetical protein